MLLVQKYLENHSFADLAKDHGVYASFSKSGHKFSLNYDQIEAKESDPLAQECRGLILALADGSSVAGVIMPDGKINRDAIIPGATQILAYPMKRFFNYGQGSAANINWSDPNLAVMEKLDGCFTYDTLLTCWDGSVAKIGDIVNKKLKLTLIGMDEQGNLVPCEIINYFNNGIKNNWLEITTSEKSKGKNRKFKVTSNHSIYINNKFIPIMKAKIGDKLTSWENNICDWTKHFIRSSLLGDATLSKNGKNFKFEEGHKEEHFEFSIQNQKWLGENFSNKGNYVSGFGSKMIRVSSRPDPIISKLREEWYIKKNNKTIKILPQDLSWIDDFSIAKWYMDDGSLSHNKNQSDRACFATNNFSEQEVIKLGEKLKEMYGIFYTVYFAKGWCLRINSGKNSEIDKMWRAISPYIINCMRYKLPIKFRNEKFIFGSKMGKIIKSKKEIEILKVKNISLIKNNKKEFPHGRSGFDIETTTKNYIANNIVVHNSLCIMYYDFIINKWCVATRAVPEADLIMDNGIFTFRTLFEKAVYDTLGFTFDQLCAESYEKYTYCYELTTPYNRIVVHYPKNGITLLSARNIETLQEVYPNEAPLQAEVPFARAYTYTSAEDLVNWISTLNPMEHEGVVVRDSNFNRIKVKNALYVAYNKARDVLGTSERNCLEIILAEKDDDVIPFLPEEIVNNLLRIKNSLQILINRYDDSYSMFKMAADAVNLGDKKTFALLVNESAKINKYWTAPFFQMFAGKAVNMKDFIQQSRKDGTWANSFLDKLLEISKNYEE